MKCNYRSKGLQLSLLFIQIQSLLGFSRSITVINNSIDVDGSSLGQGHPQRLHPCHHHHHQRLQPLKSNLFTKTDQVSQKSTRLSSTANNPTLYIFLYKTIRLQKSIRYQAVKIWNEIPSSIKAKQSFKSFKVSHKNYVLNLY